jgi:hypothetical protein
METSILNAGISAGAGLLGALIGAAASQVAPFVARREAKKEREELERRTRAMFGTMLAAVAGSLNVDFESHRQVLLVAKAATPLTEAVARPELVLALNQAEISAVFGISSLVSSVVTFLDLMDIEKAEPLPQSIQNILGQLRDQARLSIRTFDLQDIVDFSVDTLQR